jgi:hypothetical protein
MSTFDIIYVANDLDEETTLKKLLSSADDYVIHYRKDNPAVPTFANVGLNFFTCDPSKILRRSPDYWGEVFGEGATSLMLTFFKDVDFDLAGNLIIQLLIDVFKKLNGLLRGFSEMPIYF